MSTAAQQIARLEWDEAFCVGVDKIDNQNKRLMQTLNSLRDATMSKKAQTPQAVEKILNDLRETTEANFLEEEIMIYKSSSPYYDHHRGCHDQFLSAIRGFCVRFKSGTESPRMLNSEMIALLSEWLQVHILGEDQLHSLYLDNDNSS